MLIIGTVATSAIIMICVFVVATSKRHSRKQTKNITVPTETRRKSSPLKSQVTWATQPPTIGLLMQIIH